MLLRHVNITVGVDELLKIVLKSIVKMPIVQITIKNIWNKGKGQTFCLQIQQLFHYAPLGTN